MAEENKTLETKKEVKQKQNVRYLRDKDREIVKGIFKFYEVPGGTMSFVFKKYKEDPLERYDFVDGQIYSIPLGVAKHLNKNGWYPEHAFKMNEEGKPAKVIGQKIHRFGFQSLEFIDVDDLDSDEPMLTEMVEMK